MEELKLVVGRNDEQPVGLCDRARDLREELRPCDAHGDRQADALAHVAAKADGDLDRRADAPLHSANVEERLVDGEPLDDGRSVLEHPEHRLARLRVRRHPRRDDDGVRTETPGAGAAHRGADAEGLRLVARGEHDAAADDHRPAAQTRIVALLDGREEGVQVGVQDRGSSRHEHMFA